MIGFDEALRLLLQDVAPLDPVEVEEDAALGRILAESVAADRDLPPADVSTMDGFALRADDVPEPGVVLRVIGEIPAGRPVGGARVGPGQCVRIFTGALIPQGADSVVMVELTREDREGGRVEIRERPERGQHIRRAGEDVRSGETVLEAGRPVGAAEIAALAAVGRRRVRVVRPPTVRVLSTGDEVVAVERDPEPHQVRNSNARALLAQLSEMGLQGTDLGIAPDEPDTLRAALERGLDADLLLVTGGVSAGEYDLVLHALSRRGLRVIFHKVAMRPGKPVLAGRHGRCLVLGLPGNPVSAFVGFAAFAVPALRRMAGHVRLRDPELRAVLAQPLRRRPGRTTFQLGRVEIRDGRPVAWPVKSMGSGDVISLSRSNAFLVLPADGGSFQAGDEVTAIPWPGFHLR